MNLDHGVSPSDNRQFRQSDEQPVLNHSWRATQIPRERWRVSLFGVRLHVITDDDPVTAERANRQKLEANGIRVISVREGRFSLEDVFISVVEKARQEGKVASED